jgi:formate dehydrogenase subunit delta
MSADKMQKLVHMANQIADYFKVMPDADAVKGGVDHLRAFWTPKMRREIIGWLDLGGEGLNPLAVKVVDELKRASLAAGEIAANRSGLSEAEGKHKS